MVFLWENKVIIKLLFWKGGIYKMEKPRMCKDVRTYNPFLGCNYECTYCVPSLEKTNAFIEELSNNGINVMEKEMREKYQEN